MDFDPGEMFFIGAAGGLGYEMAEDEIEEREIAEDILRRRDEKNYEQVKLPLASRHEVRGKMTPFGRWATEVNKNPNKRDMDIPYTKEEQLAIIRSEGE